MLCHHMRANQKAGDRIIGGLVADERGPTVRGKILAEAAQALNGQGAQIVIEALSSVGTILCPLYLA